MVSIILVSEAYMIEFKGHKWIASIRDAWDPQGVGFKQVRLLTQEEYEALKESEKPRYGLIRPEDLPFLIDTFK